ncbi:hypothetical protein CR513_03792, partial [Mucuna pruriens]
MVTMFIDTLPSPFYDKVVGNVASSFIDFVVFGERIELGIKRGKFAQSGSNIGFTKKPNQEKKKGEANVVLLESCLPPYQPPYQPKTNNRVVASSNNTRSTQKNFRRSISRILASILMSYTELLPLLLQQNLFTTVPMRPVQPPYSKSYDPNTNLYFQEHGPNVNNNPFPAHGGTSINSISHEWREEELEEAQRGGTNIRREEEEEVGIPSDSALQSWQDRVKSALVAVIGESRNPRPKPLIIHYNPASQPRVPLIIQVPTKPTYRDNHVVPWRYREGEIAPLSQRKPSPTKEVNNIAGIGGVTRSGRIYALEEL